MVTINSTSRLFSIKTKIILTQTDTTVGFLSQNTVKLQEIKNRNSGKPFIIVYKTFKALKQNGLRIPNSQKASFRRAKKTTYIVKNQAFRVALDTLDSKLLTSVTWNYSTSANESGKMFERTFCEQKADIIVEDKSTLYEGMASSLYKINNCVTKRLR